MTEPIATATVAIKPVLDVSDLLAQVSVLLLALDSLDEPAATAGALDVDAMLAAAKDVADEDFIAQDVDGDTITIARNEYDPGVAAITVEQGGHGASAYIGEDDLDDLVAYLQALQTIRDAS